MGRADSLPPACCLTESCRCPLGRGTGCPTLYLRREEEGQTCIVQAQLFLPSSLGMGP